MNNIDQNRYHGERRDPLRVLFLITSMHVGGAETLLVNMMRRFDPNRVIPLLGCLKEFGELGKQISRSFTAFENLIRHKYDVAVLRRLKRLMIEQKLDAVITVGAGDKMFWGRLAAQRAGVPVILSALHSTGWPDGVGRLNRMLTPITDGFIAVAEPHRQYLINHVGLPKGKVRLIPNGVDTDRFVFNPFGRAKIRRQLGIADSAMVAGIVAALRPEKNHQLFLTVADEVHRCWENSHFLVAGDGPCRDELESFAKDLPCRSRIHFLGNTSEIPSVLSAMDLFSLTSHNEASPVSILEAMSVGLPVVAPNVGSIDRAVLDNKTGLLVDANDQPGFSNCWIRLFTDQDLRLRLGTAARNHVKQYGSLQAMTRGYTELVEKIHASKTSRGDDGRRQAPVSVYNPGHCPPNAASC